MNLSTDANGPSEHGFLRGDCERQASYLFIIWVLALLTADLLTLRSFPVPWVDEVMFADPAATLVLQGHWSSTLWFSRGDFIFWGGNTPGYSALLVPWLWLWGVTAPAVRSLNCVLIAVVMICAWFAVRRLKLIPRPEIRLAALVALSVCYAVSYCVRCGRPDVLGMLIFSVSGLFWSSPQKTTACLGLFISAAFIPFVGLQYAFYMPVLLGVLLWAGGKPALSRIGAIICGGIFGGILLLAYYQFIAGWDGLLANMTDVQNRRPHAFWENFRALMKGQIFSYYFGRPHFVFLIAAVAWLAAVWRHLTRASRKTLILAAIILLVPGVFIGFFSHFMAPYHWLAVAPAMILVASAFCGSWDHLGPATKTVFGLLALGLATTGRLVFLSMGAGYDTANYTAKIEAAANALVQPGEKVYADSQLYYGLKPRAGQIYYEQIVPQLTAAEKKSISIAFLLRGDQNCGLGWFTNSLGGQWVHVADLPVPNWQTETNALVLKFFGWFHAGSFIGVPISVYRPEWALPPACSH